MKFRLVMDTNVLVSAQLNPNGNEAVILTLALNPAGPFYWYVSDDILTEYRRVLHYKKFPISKAAIERLSPRCSGLIRRFKVSRLGVSSRELRI